MRNLILAAALGVGALVGLAPAKADASLLGAVTRTPNNLGAHAASYDTPANYFGTTYSDPYDLLYYGMPSDALDRACGFTAPVPAALVPATQTVRGQVKNVLADKGEFVLGDVYGKNWTFQLPPGARVHRNDRVSKIADLEVGALRHRHL